VSADPSVTPRVEEGQSQTSMDIFTEHRDVETRRVRWTGSYQRVRWGSKVGTKDEPEIILSKLFCTFSMSSPAKLQRPFRKDWVTEGNMV